MKKTFKNIFGFKAFSVLLSLSLLLGALWCVPAFAEDEGTKVNVWDGKSAEFTEGDGTAAKPYKITNGGQLFKMMNDMGKDADDNALYYELTNDVILSDATHINQWVPTNKGGDGGYSFLGHFDGKGHNITRMYYDATSRARVALIPRMGKDSSVKNVNIIGANINAKAQYSYAAAITADLLGTGVTVSNCYVDNTSIFKAKSKVAGLIAWANNCAPKVENCAFSGELYCNDTKIKTGGIVKAASGNGDVAQKTKIINCYSVGSFPVQPENYVHAVNGFEFTNVYTDIKIDDVKSEIPKYPYSETKPDNINDTLAERCDANLAKITTLTKADMQSGAAKVKMTGFDFYTAWQAVENGYPVPRTTDCTEYEGKGTATEPYVISTDAQLYALVNDADTFGRYYELANDIALNFTDTEAWYNTASQWVTADDYGTFVSFKGNFNGKGYTVSGLYVNADGVRAAGLFPILGSGAVISNLTVKNSYLSGPIADKDSFFGVIAGVVNHSIWTSEEKSNILAYPTILACGVNNATVNALFAGGIIGGGAGYAKIESSYSANLTLSNDAYTGTSKAPTKNGIIGKSWSKSSFFVKNCYTTYSSSYAGDGSVVASNVVPGVKVTENGTTAIPDGIMAGTFKTVENSVPVPDTAVKFIKVDTENNTDSLTAIRNYLLGDRNIYIVDVNNDVTFDICDLVYAALGE